MRRIATIAVLASAVALATGTSAAPALAARASARPGSAGPASAGPASAGPASAGPASAGPASGSQAGDGWRREQRYYVALGDSLSVGIQPDAAGTDVPTGQGYPDQLAAMLERRGHDLRLVKLGCSGETTVSLIDGGICSYPGDATQLTAATRFLRQHRGEVGLVTVDIGANDLNPCVALGQAAQIQSCLTALIPHVVANLTTIMSALRAAGGSRVEIIGMRYYDPELADWLTGAAGQSLAQASVGLLDTYNGYLAGVYEQYGADVADVFTAFGTTDFTDQVTLPSLGTLPRNVATICQLTWECVPPPQGPNEHATAAGYRVIADAFLDAYHPWARP